MTDVMSSCRKLPEKFGKLLSEDQLKQIEELGLLADLDDQVGPAPTKLCMPLATFLPTLA